MWGKGVRDVGNLRVPFLAHWTQPNSKEILKKIKQQEKNQNQKPTSTFAVLRFFFAQSDILRFENLEAVVRNEDRVKKAASKYAEESINQWVKAVAFWWSSIMSRAPLAFPSQPEFNPFFPYSFRAILDAFPSPMAFQAAARIPLSPLLPGEAKFKDLNSGNDILLPSPRKGNLVGLKS